MILFAFKKRELKEKTQDVIKNPNPLLKNAFRIRIRMPKLTKNWADPGSRIRIASSNNLKRFHMNCPKTSEAHIRKFSVSQYCNSYKRKGTEIKKKGLR